MFQKKSIDIGAPEKHLLKNSGAGYILIPIVLEIALGVLVFIQSRPAAMNYLYALAASLFLTAVIGTYAYNRNADMRLFSAAASLSAFGVALQIVIDQVYRVSTVFSPLKYAISLATAVIFLIFYRIFRKILDRPVTVWLMILVSAAIYAVLKVYGYDPNGYGTYAWLKIGSYTVQLTDFAKVAAVMFYSALFSSRTPRSEKEVLLI